MRLASMVLTASTVSAGLANASPRVSRMRPRNQVNLAARTDLQGGAVELVEGLLHKAEVLSEAISLEAEGILREAAPGGLVILEDAERVLQQEERIVAGAIEGLEREAAKEGSTALENLLAQGEHGVAQFALPSAPELGELATQGETAVEDILVNGETGAAEVVIPSAPIEEALVPQGVSEKLEQLVSESQLAAEELAEEEEEGVANVIAPTAEEIERSAFLKKKMAAITRTVKERTMIRDTWDTLTLHEQQTLYDKFLTRHNDASWFENWWSGLDAAGKRKTAELWIGTPLAFGSLGALVYTVAADHPFGLNLRSKKKD